jgi:hypothetical protein
MPARKRCPCLKAALLLYASRSEVLFPPRCGINTTATPTCSHSVTLISLKKLGVGAVQIPGRSPRLACGVPMKPPHALIRRVPFRTSQCVIRPCALSARRTLWPNYQAPIGGGHPPCFGASRLAIARRANVARGAARRRGPGYKAGSSSPGKGR